MSNLFEKRSQMEQNYKDATQERAEAYYKAGAAPPLPPCLPSVPALSPALPRPLQTDLPDAPQALEDLRVADAEEYNILKIRLETDIQNLEQYLEAMRATYQLNTEKLEYNYRVLVERDHENQSTINQQKRKIARQRDILSGLKDRYSETDRRFQEENQKLTDEYKRITEQFKFLQGKFRHFELSDIKKYHDIWNMKEKAVAELVKEVLQADKIIHEQQLGWDWRPPSDEVFVSPHDAAAEPSAGPGGEGDDPGEDDDSEAAEQAAKDVVAERTRDPRYYGALQLLVDEAGFLVDSKARKMIEALPKDEAGAQACAAASPLPLLPLSPPPSHVPVPGNLAISPPESLWSSWRACCRSARSRWRPSSALLG